MKTLIILLRRGLAATPRVADQLGIGKVGSASRRSVTVLCIVAVYVRHAGNGMLVEGEVTFNAEAVGPPPGAVSARL